MSIMDTDRRVEHALAANRDRQRRAMQREAALDAANTRRVAIADLKDELHADASWRVMVDLLERRLERPYADRARIRDLLVAMPGIGPTKARRLLAGAGVRNLVRTRRLGELVDEQRRALAEDLVVRRRGLTDSVVERMASTPRPR